MRKRLGSIRSFLLLPFSSYLDINWTGQRRSCVVILFFRQHTVICKWLDRKLPSIDIEQEPSASGDTPTLEQNNHHQIHGCLSMNVSGACWFCSFTTLQSPYKLIINHMRVFQHFWRFQRSSVRTEGEMHRSRISCEWRH